MTVDIDTQISNRLSAAEQDLLDAITDLDSFSQFDSRWMVLVDDIKDALDVEVLTPSTIAMVYTLADKVSSVGQALLDLESLTEKAMSSLTLETSSILSPSDTATASTPSDLPLPSLPLSSRVPYIEPSYIWLLDNIHNPYPSTHTRNKIARETGSARKDIDGWFIDARKRIGWNALRKTWFSNKRVDIVEAATKFFMDGQLMAGHESLGAVFAEIESNAKELYSEKFSKSDLAAQLDMVVKDMTPEMKAQANAGARRRRLLESEEQRSTAVFSYPSPDRSLSRSPELAPPSPSPSQDELGEVSTILPQSRKRRGSSVDHGNTDGPNKRSRNGLSFPHSSGFLAGLPSPISSDHASLASDEDDIAIPRLSASIPTIVSTTLNRKRRLSDADGQGPPKRPRNLPVGPRLHAVSDPMPFPSAHLTASEFDGWFQKHFEHTAIPAMELETSTPLEVELFDFSTFNNDNQLTDCVQYPSPQIQDYNDLYPPPDIQPFELDVTTNNFNYDELFSSDGLSQEYEGYAVQSNLSNFSYPIPAALGTDLSSTFFNLRDVPGPIHHNPDRALIVDSSSPVSNNPVTNLDWALPPFISLPDTMSGDTFQDLSNTFPQDIDTLNPLMTMNKVPVRPINHISEEASQSERAAKQLKLLEIQEVARRLEAELAATPC